MVQIVQLSEIREQHAARAGFAAWRRRFDEDYDNRIRIMDLSNTTLCCLAEPGEESDALLNALIFGILGYDETLVFGDLAPGNQTRILDIHLFLADQIRFELMRRMTWIEKSAVDCFPILDIVRDFGRVRARFASDPPRLARSHPGYGEYSQLIHRDQQVFIRRLLPAALEAFKSFCAER
jgi:hypothetical protein